MAQLRRELCNGSAWGQDKRATQALWVVYSDRDSNVTYTAPDRMVRYGSLRFGEKVCIARIENDMALVYSDEKHRYPDIPSGIKSKGWVPMENLLLWTKCPIGRQGVQRKVISSINLDWMSSDGRIKSKKYNSPDDLNRSTPISTDMNFYYVMKETYDGEYALLSSSSTIVSAQSLYGWVDKNDITDFIQRVFLEPEWEPMFVEMFRGKGACFYEDDGMNSQVAQWEYGTSNGDSTQEDQYRMNHHQLRFPVLSKPDENGMVCCMSFGTPDSYDQEFLKRRIGDKGYQDLTQMRNNICSFKGYVKKDPGWKYVLLLSSDELSELLELIAPIKAVAQEQLPDRNKFIDALLSCLKSQMGIEYQLKDSELEKMPIWKLLYKIYGVDMVEESHFDLYEQPLKDLKNKKKVPDTHFYDIIDRFYNRFGRLTRALNGYNFRTDIGGMYYYWIPLDDMP